MIANRQVIIITFKHLNLNHSLNKTCLVNYNKYSKKKTLIILTTSNFKPLFEKDLFSAL